MYGIDEGDTHLPDDYLRKCPELNVVFVGSRVG
jgi:hypothetical protein